MKACIIEIDATGAANVEGSIKKQLVYQAKAQAQYSFTDANSPAHLLITWHRADEASKVKRKDELRLTLDSTGVIAENALRLASFVDPNGSSATKTSKMSCIKHNQLLRDRIFSSYTDLEIKQFCQNKKEFFKKFNQQAVTFESLGLDIENSSANVVFLAENHREPHRQYGCFLSKIKKTLPDLNCIAFEDDDQRNMSFKLPKWRDLRSAGNALQMATYLIDGCPQNSSSTELADSCIQGRNRFMAMQIQDLLTTGQCNKILVLNGDRHVQSQSPDAISIPDYLRSFGVKPYAVRLVVDANKALAEKIQSLGGIEQGDALIWMRRVFYNQVLHQSKLVTIENCMASISKSNYAVLTHLLPEASTALVQFQERQLRGYGYWKDYDAALVIGAPDSDPQCTN